MKTSHHSDNQRAAENVQEAGRGSPLPRMVRSLPATTGFFWWRETPNDAWRVIQVISHELDGAVTDPDYLSTYDVHHHRWSGRSMRCWREYDPIGEWCEILPPNANVDLPDTAAQYSASKSNSPAVSG